MLDGIKTQINNFSNLELLEYNNLKSNSAKNLYCLLKRSNTNSQTINIKDFNEAVLNKSIVEMSYLQEKKFFKDIERDILKPIINELSSEYDIGFKNVAFKDLSYEKITEEGRGRYGKVNSIIFKWK